MPLDTTSTYSQTLLRTDGRRWNEFRRISASISTQSASDGSSLFTMGNSMIVCTVTGPREGKGQRDNNNATVETEVNIAAFAQQDRRRRMKGDKRIQELQYTISNTLQSHLSTHLYPRSTISIQLHVLSLDGGLLAACINASTLALADAGVPMPSMLSAVTSGLIESAEESGKTVVDPVLDLNNAEEQELPFLTVATVGAQPSEEDKVAVLVMESKVQIAGNDGGGGGKLESMLAVGVDGCKQVRRVMEGVLRTHGSKVLRARK